jgi:hypothetical protein
MNIPILPVDLAEDPGPDDRKLDKHDVSAELAPPATDYLTQIDMNHILGNLFALLAANRISAKRAGTLAYICSAILKSQEGMRTQVKFMELTSLDWVLKALKERYGPKPESGEAETSEAATTPVAKPAAPSQTFVNPDKPSLANQHLEPRQPRTRAR